MPHDHGTSSFAFRLKVKREEVVESVSMRAIVLKLTGVVLTASLLVVAPANAVEVEFIAFSAVDQWDAKTYRAIWKESGDRIVEAFEAVTCLPFAESIVPAVVAERVSNSGGPEHPMQLRASYVRAVKQATLVHELGHRDLWQLTRRLDGVDGHMTLYLVLDRVWAYVWGEEFAQERIRDESGWRASYDYGAAWRWARSLGREERVRLWNELLIKNGFPGGCKPVSEGGGDLASVPGEAGAGGRHQKRIDEDGLSSRP